MSLYTLILLPESLILMIFIVGWKDEHFFDNFHKSHLVILHHYRHLSFLVPNSLWTLNSFHSLVLIILIYFFLLLIIVKMMDLFTFFQVIIIKHLSKSNTTFKIFLLLFSIFLLLVMYFWWWEFCIESDYIFVTICI